MTNLNKMRAVLEGVLGYGPIRMQDTVRGLLAELPREGAILSAEDLTWALHDELCQEHFHTTACWDQWTARGLRILEAARLDEEESSDTREAARDAGWAGVIPRSELDQTPPALWDGARPPRPDAARRNPMS